MEFPIRKLLKHKDSFEPLIWWENLFGRAFSAIRPFLTPCDDRRGDFYPSPDNPTVQLTVRESGRRYRAYPPDELGDELDDLILDWEDVQAHRFSCTRLRAALRKVFRLKSAAGCQIKNLCYIGRCECNKEFRHVYACLSESAHDAHAAIENLTDPKQVGCVLFPTYYGKIFDRLKSRGIAAVALRECLTLKKDGFHGECPVNCADCLLPVSTQLESRLDTIEKTILPDAKRGTKTKKSASAGGKARAETYAEKYEEARRFIRKYHRENRSMCFTQALRKAAQHLDLGESTLKKHIKKRDFPDW